MKPITRRLVHVALFLGGLTAAAADAPPIRADDLFRFPPTRAGKIAQAYFESFNSGDEKKMLAFETTYRSAGALEKRRADARVERLLQLRAQTGDLIPVEITDEQAGSLTVTAHAKKPGIWVSCTFSIERTEPYKLISVAIMPGTAPDAEAEYAKEWKDLEDLLGQIRSRSGVPAIAAALVEKGAISDVAAVGERWAGSGQAVERGDAWHLGSIAKSMTATMIAALVQKELLAWDFTIEDILAGTEMRDEYRAVTLEELLQHRGGFPGYTNMDDDEIARYRSASGGPTRQREAFVADVLMAQPVEEPGRSMRYSNAGYVVAALMAERVSARGWEELMKVHVFEPAGMKSAGYGWPATPANPNQPRGHYKEGDEFRPQEFREYELGPFLAPAGDVHCSIEDLARYAGLHLRGLAGKDKDFDAEIIRRLHTPPDVQGDEMRYAAGWAVVTSPEVGRVHSHSGSAGTFFATIELYPDYDVAIVLATNGGLEAGTAVSKEITDLVKRRLRATKSRR